MSLNSFQLLALTTQTRGQTINTERSQQASSRSELSEAVMSTTCAYLNKKKTRMKYSIPWVLGPHGQQAGLHI